MLIFAVESSCDETAVALYDSKDDNLLCHKLYSQVTIHSAHGGVVPELAARNHIQKLIPLTKLCFKESGIDKKDIQALAYTCGPGLIPCLMAGASYARALAYGLGVPALGINHLEGHILSPLLAEDKPEFPYVALLVSGGHSQIYLVKDYGEYILGGTTLDDAAGEAFDKVAALLGLGYPGGAELENLAQGGDPARYSLSMPLSKKKEHKHNFSFSGIKTEIRYLVDKLEKQGEQNYQADLAASFQHTVVKGMLSKIFSFASEHRIQNIAIVGGVSANSHFRKQAVSKQSEISGKIYFAPPQFCTDNAAMIAIAAGYRFKQEKRQTLTIKAQARYPLII